MATKFNTQDGYLVKMEDRILPATQVKGACLNMKPSYQSLRNPMPHNERGNPQEVLKSLLSQKRDVLWMGPLSKQ